MARRGSQLAVWVIAAGVGVLVLLCGGATTVGGLLLLGTGRVVQAAASDTLGELSTRTYDREELRRLVEGKTEEELVILLGKPARTTELTNGYYLWAYRGLTIDPANGQRDFYTWIRLHRGKVHAVTY